ncbi:hypothetical protein ACFFJ7_19175 [Pseudochelatococcus lubricantis]|uniref:hypothetical protein n=1 Tax=Pseudochelatococcus lubricantis TaxID=1538102 RepID=UPI0035EE253C
MSLRQFLLYLGKGGSGKSLMAMLNASQARKEDRNIAIFDADVANPTLTRYFPGYFDAHPDHVMPGASPEDVEEWLELVVFNPDEASYDVVLMDVGANIEGPILNWLGTRGADFLPLVRVIIPIDSRDAVTAGVIIAECVPHEQVLFVVNERGGRHAKYALEEPVLREALKKGAKIAVFPVLGRSIVDVHRLSIPPDELEVHGNLFEKQGARTLLRLVTEIFPEEFRP